MPRLKQIYPDVYTLYALGCTSTLGASILVHAARCGLHGTTVPSCADIMGLCLGTTTFAIRRLVRLGLLTSYATKTGKGRAVLYVVTAKAWEALTKPVDHGLFPDALKPCPNIVSPLGA